MAHGSDLNVIVMAKSAVPGSVKTRLIGALTAVQAAAVHQAMMILAKQSEQQSSTNVLEVVG